MAYIPVASRTGGAATGAYVPVASRVAAQPPPDYSGTIGEIPISSPSPIKTSTQAIPDETTGNPFKTTLGAAKDVGQSIARSAASAALTISKKINPAADSFKPEDFHSFFNQALVETVFGKDPNKSIEDRIVEAEPKVKAWGEELQQLAKTPTLNPRERAVTQTLADLATNHPSSLAFTGIMGSVGLDLSPFGGLEKNAYKAIMNAKTEEETFQVLSKMGVTEDLARQFAPDAVKTVTEADAKKLFSSVAKLQETTKPVTAGAYVPVAQRVQKIAAETPGVRVAEDIVPPELKDLATMARKYQTVEEFKANIGSKQFREFLNATEGDGSKVPSARATGARVRKAGDYLYNQDRGYFDAHLADINKGRNTNQGFQTSLDEFYAKATKGQISTERTAVRVNTKLEKMAADSPSFAEFYKRSGITMDSLNMTAKKQGYKNAQEFYFKNKPAAANGAMSSSEIASLERSAQMAQRENLPPLPRFPVSQLRQETDETKQALDLARNERDMGREIVHEMPGKVLQPYESRSFPGELPEVANTRTLPEARIKQLGKFAKSGDRIITDLGFKDIDEATKALQDYKRMRTQYEAAEANVSARVKNYRDRKAVFDEVVRYVQQEGAARRDKVKLVQDFFKLTNADVKDLLKGERDVRLMNDGEFDDFLKRFEGKATESYLKMQDLVDLKATIFDKEFVKLDNLRQAMKLPKIENMTPAQMRFFNETLQEFKVGDQFLGVRQLETVKNTDLAGIKTIREARERLLVDINKLRASRGLTPATIEDLTKIKTGWMDHFRYDVALARQNPIYDLIVHETHKELLNAEAQVLEVKDKVNELFATARKSRSRSILEKLIPTDKRIFQWLEAPDAEKIFLAKDMTHEELEAAMYVRAWYAEARDYLIQQQTLKRYISDYITHIRRGFLEGWYEETKKAAVNVAGGKGPGIVKRTGTGLLAAFKEVFKAYKDEEAFFNIMNEKTGDVLPLEKFFQFSMKRTGELIPTQNAASAFLKYVTTFEKKRALDALIPKLDIYVHSISPNKLTPRGVEMDDSLKTFFKQWMNTKKGRPMALGPLRPGNPLDWAMRTGVALVRLLDLGAAVPIGIASNAGAQSVAYVILGAKAYKNGVARLATKEGREFISHYKNLVGEPAIGKMRAADATLGQNLQTAVYSFFSFADRQSRQVLLLGSITPKEFASGGVSADRLTEIQNKMGRYLPMENMTSTMGKTALGKVATQYKGWAVTILSTTADNINKLQKAVRAGNFKEVIQSQEGKELIRTILLSSVVGFSAYGVLNDKTPMKDKSFMEKVASKLAQDALSSISALDPSFWLGEPRLMKFLGDLGTAAHQIATIQKNKDGEFTGVKTLENTLTPGVIKQVLPPAEPASTSKGGLPGLPKLPKGGGGLRALPKIR